MWGSEPTPKRAPFGQPEPGLQLLKDALWRGVENFESQILAPVRVGTRKLYANENANVNHPERFLSYLAPLAEAGSV